MAIAKTLIAKFQVVKIEQLGRDLNGHTDALVDLASTFEGENG